MCVNGKPFRYNFCSGSKSDPIQCKRGLSGHLDLKICETKLKEL